MIHYVRKRTEGAEAEEHDPNECHVSSSLSTERSK
jgi:hypothetical protein